MSRRRPCAQLAASAEGHRSAVAAQAAKDTHRGSWGLYFLPSSARFSASEPIAAHAGTTQAMEWGGQQQYIRWRAQPSKRKTDIQKSLTEAAGEVAVGGGGGGTAASCAAGTGGGGGSVLSSPDSARALQGHAHRLQDACACVALSRLRLCPLLSSRRFGQ